MYIRGNHWLICDSCGFKVRRSNARKRWDGAMVCLDDWEPRHPMDFFKSPGPDLQFVRDARPRPVDVFRETTGLQQAIGEDQNLLTEDGDVLLTEDGDFLELE